MRILNLEPKDYSFKANKILESLGHVDCGPLNRSTLINKIKAYDILVARLGHQINSEVIQAGTSLQVIVSATTGLNHIDLNVAREHNIEVLSLRGEREFLDGIYATAEHTWALLLALVRNVPGAHSHVLAGNWDRDLFRGRELYGRTLGIIGLGRLGSKVAWYGLTFGMKVLAYDTDNNVRIPNGVQPVSLETVLVESDVITLHVNYIEENHGMMGIKQFTAMKKGSFFINTSRGELVDEAALLKSLRSGHIGGAALDVLCGEYNNWEVSQPLIDYARENSNLIITPHIGGCTLDSMKKTEVFMANKLQKYLLQRSKD